MTKGLLWFNFIVALTGQLLFEHVANFTEVRAWGSAILVFIFATEMAKVLTKQNRGE